MTDRQFEAFSGVQLFNGLSDKALRSVAAKFVPQWLDDGEVLFYAKGPPDRFYVVTEGEIEIVRFAYASLSEVVIATLGAGEAFGEMSILQGGRRSATARAKGRTQVYWLGAEAFLALIRKRPVISVNVARVLGERLFQVQEHLYAGWSRPTWAVMLGGDLTLPLARRLMQSAADWLPAHAQHQKIVFLAAGGAPGIRELGRFQCEERVLAPGDDIDQQLDAADDEAALIAVAATPDRLGPLGGRCQALVRSAAGPAAPVGRWDHEVALVTEGPPSKSRVRFDPRLPREALDRVARILLRRSVGMALGGGAALGFAHLGVLQALDEEKIPVDFIAGTSMGALLGAFTIANGLQSTVALSQRLDRPRDWLRLVDRSALISGLIAGRRIERFIDSELQRRTFADLAIPLAAVAVDLDTGQELVLDQGKLVEAIHASIAIPGLFTPYEHTDPQTGRRHRLVDGGVVNNVPVDICRGMGADRVIGVHVIRPALSLGVGAPGRLLSQAARLPILARIEAILRSQYFLMLRTGERQVYTADVALIPDTAEYGFLEFWRSADLIGAGYAVAREHMARLTQLTL